MIGESESLNIFADVLVTTFTNASVSTPVWVTTSVPSAAQGQHVMTVCQVGMADLIVSAVNAESQRQSSYF